MALSSDDSAIHYVLLVLCLPISGQAKAMPIGRRILKVIQQGAELGQSLMSVIALF